MALIDISTPKHPRTMCLVNTDDLPLVLDGKGRWSARQSGRSIYAARAKGSTSELMHQRLLRVDPGRVWDHRNTDSLDNRRKNLRGATRAENAQNRRDHPGSSQYKGVHWHQKAKKWCSQICVNYKRMIIGRFDDEVIAARAYDAAAREHFGEFARLNFPGETQ